MLEKHFLGIFHLFQMLCAGLVAQTGILAFCLCVLSLTPSLIALVYF